MRLHDGGGDLPRRQQGHCRKGLRPQYCQDQLLGVQIGLTRQPAGSAIRPAKVDVDRPLVGADLDCSNRRLEEHQKIQLDMGLSC